ncbi:MAG: hypothetical protein U1F09_12860 [Steroidobacteraceae bacterium]
MNRAPVVRSFRIPADHPCLAGHFPDSPVVPAVVILDEVLSAAGLGQPSLQVESLLQAKFLRPLLPDVVATVRIGWRERSLLFSVTSGMDTIAVGTFKLSAIETP